jgi:hypothetical protein
MDGFPKGDSSVGALDSERCGISPGWGRVRATARRGESRWAELQPAELLINQFLRFEQNLSCGRRLKPILISHVQRGHLIPCAVITPSMA